MERSRLQTHCRRAGHAALCLQPHRHHRGPAGGDYGGPSHRQSRAAGAVAGAL
ncbi:hypothetical protein TSOC_003183 [Tetrabaena socialis]|uniref:Uncharacterized protein n=1 Tax=Tetrabaena socialis TaxID=47790 RepID=A0A2J8AC74_9CHLO|nr:hypothetical protein TSOC_003183 [Tetrabaena socialis]|eukprot:PNH10121.1 hypothetical protein TSOC_003183 [Tetrabaena socialis]